MKRLLFPLPIGVDDINYYSGSFSSVYQSLKNVYELIPVGPLKLHKNLLLGGFNKLNELNLFPWRFATMHTWETVYGYAKQIQPLIDSIDFDGIFTPNFLVGAGVNTKKPIFAYGDLSFYNSIDYYPFATNLFPSSLKTALAVDKFCFENYTITFLASEWARKETIKAYKLDESKIIAIGRGANLTSGYSSNELIRIIDNRFKNEKKKFLFVGREWDRKGGDLAFEIVKQLFQRMGRAVTLQFVGCNVPNHIRKLPFIETYPFLNRKNESELMLLRSLFQDANFFIMPTKAEAMGIAFAEANSFALPSISNDTGGVSTVIENEKTGLLLNNENTVEVIINKIQSLIEDKTMYTQMSLNAFNKYQNELNWITIAERIKKEIDLLL